MTDFVAQFVRAYEREVDFYSAAAQRVQQQLEVSLRANGIKAIPTARAKRSDSLEKKLRKRMAEGRSYADLEAIRADLPDLSGARVALYFPAQREKVNQLISGLFVPIQPPKEHPVGGPVPIATVDGAPYRKRFLGYCATHHRVQLRDDQVAEDERRLTSATVEIQVASVLMHAWAEVEHDLVYKPTATLSEEELAILDEINGLVIAGEIALERLQRARDRRIDDAKGPFDGPYDLASYLFNYVRKTFGTAADQETMGHADRLLALLERTGQNARDKLAPILKQLRPEDFDRQPIAEQVADKILGDDKDLYAWFDSLKGGSPPEAQTRDAAHLALGRFLDRWIAVEWSLTEIARRILGSEAGLMPRPRDLNRLADEKLVPVDAISEFLRIRRLRNHAVHGTSREVSPDLLDSAALGAERILRSLAASDHPDVREPAIEALDRVQPRAETTV